MSNGVSMGSGTLDDLSISINLSSTMPFVTWISGRHKVLIGLVPCGSFDMDSWIQKPMELSIYSHGRWNIFVGLWALHEW